MAKVGRNEPCPCASGKKYKQCCIDKKDDLDRALDIVELDGRVVTAALGAMRRAAPDWEMFELLAGIGLDDAQILAPIVAFMTPGPTGKTPAGLFIESRDATPRERAYVEAQSRAWLSIWEVERVDSGRSMELRDRLTGETRTVFERSGSRTQMLRACVLARVVDFEGISKLAGLHPRPLAPKDGDRLVRAVLKHLSKGQLMAPAVLRIADNALFLVDAWEEIVAAADEIAATPPRLQNTDGDDLVIVRDKLSFANGAAVGDALAMMSKLEGAAEDDDGGLVFSKPGNAQNPTWDNTIVGSAKREGDAIVLETNSIERANALRQRIFDACGAVPPAHRETTSGAALLERTSPRPQRVPSDEEREILKQMIDRHFASWPDMKLPALGGKSPRQALRTKKGRASVELLVKEMEHLEARKPDDQRYDVERLRDALGI